MKHSKSNSTTPAPAATASPDGKLVMPVDRGMDFVIVRGAAKWPDFAARLHRAFRFVWRRLPSREKQDLAKDWGPDSKTEAWVVLWDRIFDTEGEQEQIYGRYWANERILEFGVHACMPMPDEELRTLVAHEIGHAIDDARRRHPEGFYPEWPEAPEDPEVTEDRVGRATLRRGYDERALDDWFERNSLKPTKKSTRRNMRLTKLDKEIAMEEMIELLRDNPKGLHISHFVSLPSFRGDQALTKVQIVHLLRACGLVEPILEGCRNRWALRWKIKQ